MPTSLIENSHLKKGFRLSRRLNRRAISRGRRYLRHLRWRVSRGRLAFIHTPKCAGRSLNDFLFSNRQNLPPFKWLGHARLAEASLERALRGAQWVALTRNPADWYLSVLGHQKRRRKSEAILDNDSDPYFLLTGSGLANPEEFLRNVRSPGVLFSPTTEERGRLPAAKLGRWLSRTEAGLYTFVHLFFCWEGDVWALNSPRQVDVAISEMAKNCIFLRSESLDKDATSLLKAEVRISQKKGEGGQERTQLHRSREFTHLVNRLDGKCALAVGGYTSIVSL